MKTGQLEEVAGSAQEPLSLVSQKKSLSFREKKMYERAKYFIVSEVAHVKGLDEKKPRSWSTTSPRDRASKRCAKAREKRAKEAAGGRGGRERGRGGRAAEAEAAGRDASRRRGDRETAR